MNNIKKYFYIQLPFVFIMALISMFIRNNPQIIHKERFSDVTSISNSITTIYDQMRNPVGKITIKKNDNEVLCSISGKEIKGISVLGHEFILNNINYDNLHFTLRDAYNENYLYSKNNGTIKIIIKISKANKKYLEDAFAKEKSDIYMFVEFPEIEFDYRVDNILKYGLQEICLANIDSNIYSCFFIL